jgi:hypothetical protein
MAPRVNTHVKDLLRVLHKAKPSLRKAILREADRALVHQICEICDNTLAGHVPLSPSQKQKLKKHKQILRNLAHRTPSWKSKKNLLQKGGAFLPLLLTILSSVLPSVLGG